MRPKPRGLKRDPVGANVKYYIFDFLTQCWKSFQKAADGFTVYVKLQTSLTLSNGHPYKRYLQIK